jgi:hypothetical protein
MEPPVADSIWWAIIINKKKLNFKVAIAITALYLVWNAFSVRGVMGSPA